jgi:Tfp pilus assembly protein PilO
MEKSFDKQQVRRARITAILLAFSIVISLISIVYAFTCKNEVERISKDADEVVTLAAKYRLEAEQSAAEANMRLATALKALDECKANTK